MRKQAAGSAGMSADFRPANRGEARIIIIALAALVIGLACGAYWHYRQAQKQLPEAPLSEEQRLSEATVAVLQRLDSPVEINLYAPASSGDLSEAMAAFVVRVQQLLSEYQRVAGDKIRLTQSDPATSASAKAAAGKDGLLPLADKNGEVFYLGVAISQRGRKEAMAQLSPDWEAALESDLSRAIARVSAATATPIAPVPEVSAAPVAVDPALNEELLRTIPDLESRSFEDAAKILREASLVEFTAAVREMQSNVQEMQKQLAATQGNKSEADQQAAMKQLQQAQNEGTKKLGEITAQLQVRLKALERLKGVKPSAPK